MVIKSTHGVHKRKVTVDVMNLILRHHAGIYSEADVLQIASGLDILEGNHAQR